MDLFMPAERVLYNRSYYFSDEAVDDYNEYIADRDGVNIDVVSSLDFFMNEVWKEIDYAIDNDLSDEISCFDRMLRDLKCGGDPEHPTEISVVAKGTVERWNYGPIYYFPHESVEQIVGQLCEDGDDFPILFDGENVIEAFDGSPVHMSVPVEVDGERVWTCGYDFCWGETVAPDFSRARGHFPDATVAAWAAARSVNESDGNLGIKERM